MLAGGVLFLSLITACSGVKNDKEKSKPNIIVLLVDDAGYADFGFNGSKDLQTPNIDKLASTGVVFTDAHVSASVCGPSRAGLITGRYQQRFGFECNPNGTEGINLNETTMAAALKQVGYTTAAFGKWHLGAQPGFRPTDRGFDYFWGFLAGGRSYFSNKNNDVEGNAHAIIENTKHVTFDGYLTDRLGEKAVAFIDKNNENPFFIYWAPNAVHTPMEATDEDLARFEGHPRQTLAAMTWALDRAVGNIVDKLDEEGLLNNTLIFFLSDNGGSAENTSINLPLKGFKGNKYEGGQRVAFFATWASQIQKGEVFHGLTSSLDIYATAADVAGVTRVDDLALDGVSLMPFLKNEKMGQPHEALFWRKDKMAAARVRNLKIIRVENLPPVLYNLEDDLGETTNLVHKDPQAFKSVKGQLEKWEEGLMKPLWTEGQTWDTITWMIHQDLMNNREVRVKNPGQLNKFRSND